MFGTREKNAGKPKPYDCQINQPQDHSNGLRRLLGRKARGKSTKREQRDTEQDQRRNRIWDGGPPRDEISTCRSKGGKEKEIRDRNGGNRSKNQERKKHQTKIEKETWKTKGRIARNIDHIGCRH
jgi:hypothetical protein